MFEAVREKEASQCVEVGQVGLRLTQRGLEENQAGLGEEAGRKMELGAPGSGKAAGWRRQKSPPVRGCAI